MESTSRTISPSRAGAIGAAFTAAAAEGRAAVVAYVTAGHPDPAQGLEVLETVARAGADVIELGVPFSDPLADGPTIQKSSFEAITRGVDLSWTLDLLRRFRERHDTPVVIFTYLNPIFGHGIDAFVRDAVEAGADGVLVTDLPAGSDGELERALIDSPLDLIRLIAPTTRPERVLEIARGATGFLYYVSRTGVTGAREQLTASLQQEVEAIRAVIDLPLAVGFGISTPEQAATVARFADGVIVGSALVDTLAREGVEPAGRLVEALHAASRRG